MTEGDTQVEKGGRVALEQRLDYLEQTISRLIIKLKEKNCLDQEFEFSTEAEQKQKLEKFVNNFIKTEVHLDH